MNSYTIGSGFMIAALAAFTLWIAFRLIKLGFTKKAEFKNYIKTYKYGKFLWVYLLAIPLFAMSYHYSGVTGFDCFFKAFTSASKLLGLQFDVTLELTGVNTLYKSAVILCYCIAILNLVLFVLSCLGQVIWNRIALGLFKYGKKDRCLILGNNTRNEIIYKSIPKSRKSKVYKLIADAMDKSQRWDLYTKSIHYHSSSDVEALQKYVKNLFEKLIKKYNKWFNKAWKKSKEQNHKHFSKLQIIINFDNEAINANMCAYLSNIINSYTEKNREDIEAKKQLDCLPYLDVYIYGNNDNKLLYSGYNIDFSGCLHFVSDESSIAMDFIKKYPVAKYLTSKQIDYETSLLKKNTKVSISFVGFGQTQQEVFKALYTNTQFARLNGKKLDNKCVEYAIYDKVETWETTKTFSNIYNNWFHPTSKFDQSKYFELPNINVPKFYKCDINSKYFMDISEKVLEAHKKSNDLKYILISLDDELASIDYANRLWAKIESSNIRNCHIFVKINDKDTFENMSLLFKKKRVDTKKNISCNVYGCLTDTAFDYETIIMEDITKLSIMGDQIYNCSIYEDSISPDKELLDFKKDIIEQSRNKWTKDSEYNRNSSMSSALHIKSKLLIMGLDYALASDQKQAAFDDFNSFWNRLDKKHPPQLSKKDVLDGKENGVDYLVLVSPKKNYNNVKSRRWVLVFIEHNRWNAFNIISGYVPLSKKDIIPNRSHRNKTAKKHACLTTMEGLQHLEKYLSVDCVRAWKKELVQCKASLKKLSNTSIAYRQLSKKINSLENAISSSKNCDMFKLDYLQIDAIWQFLKKIGYKIVTK